MCGCSRHVESRRRKRKEEQKQDAADADAEELERAAARQRREEEAQLRAEGKDLAECLFWTDLLHEVLFQYCQQSHISAKPATAKQSAIHCL